MMTKSALMQTVAHWHGNSFGANMRDEFNDNWMNGRQAKPLTSVTCTFDVGKSTLGGLEPFSK